MQKWISIMIKIKKFIKIIFGTENNILLKFNLSCFITGILFFIFSLMFQSGDKQQPYIIFTCISGILLAIWLITMANSDSVWEVSKEFFRLAISFVVLIFSINFCINQSVNLNGFKLIFYAILSCIGILLCSFYLISKFIDILKITKKMITKFKHKLFDSLEPTTSKVKSLIENITAFLVAIASLGVAAKTIIEPLINLIK